ncbi:hypothetical protein [Thermofilum pendens]|uniref:Uncharacterized protein n=1 Tax=Thermofilum pendens (strain DSM 2475 / Hrk 5) TaxID=368408 RepID=A1RY26_THEPD|nr:hypothetical protein [Thermofilum pendens]ABL78106.1 hypothetical protein Tpen_0704 [Thermofilum pendens Hrk 5]
MKAFAFELKAVDPKPLDLAVKPYLLTVCSGKATVLSPVRRRQFLEEDLVGFDEEIGFLIGIVYNDFFHGEGNVEVFEYDVSSSCEMVAKIYEVRDSGFLYYRARVYKRSEGVEGWTVIFSDHFSKPGRPKHKLEELSAIIGVRLEELAEALKEEHAAK